MEKTKSLLKKLKPTTTSKVTPLPIKHIPITQLSQEQKEAALPFLTEPKQKSSKTKSIGKFFKKLAKATTSIKKSNNTEYKLTFIPITENKEITATEIVWTAPMEEDKKSTDIAQRIYENDNTVYENLENVVEWIGNGKPSSNAILKSYMSHYDFKSLSLEQAFRNLCLKLHLKGESQQIDRILSEFAGRYFECNPKCIFGSTDVVHAIVYSLLLLNTDLHVAQGDYKKMSRSEFINNTLNAIQAQPNTPASFDFIPLQRTPSNTSAVSSRSSTYAQSFDLPRDLTSYSLGSKTWQLEIKNVLKHMYNNIRSTQLANPTSPPASIRKVSSVFRRSNLFKREDETMSTSSVASSSMASSLCPDLQTDLPMTYTSNAPYHKEGMVVRKHLLEKANQKAKHRDWKDCFMVIERSQVFMYKLDAHKKRKTEIGGGDWMSSASLMGTIDLKHSLANALPSGYSRQRQHAFALQQANGAVTIFQVGSAEQVQEWVSTCNYWAARESKEPLSGGVSSMEYGWGESTDMVYEWQAPTPPTMSSLLDEASQLETLHKYVKDLSADLDQHRDIKPKMEAKFMNSKFQARAMMNWENKSHYLLHEIIKYQNYCNSIEKSLEIQNTFMSS